MPHTIEEVNKYVNDNKEAIDDAFEKVAWAVRYANEFEANRSISDEPGEELSQTINEGIAQCLTP